jgi:flagellar biosynthesis protein FliQ
MLSVCVCVCVCVCVAQFQIFKHLTDIREIGIKFVPLAATVI